MRPSRTLIEGSLSRGLILFALPILFGNVLQTVNGSINSVWVGQFLGEASLAATSNANSVMFLLLGGVFGLSMAATILVGQNIGAGQVFEAKRVVGTSATFFAVLSSAITGGSRRCIWNRAGCRRTRASMRWSPRCARYANRFSTGR